MKHLYSAIPNHTSERKKHRSYYEQDEVIDHDQRIHQTAEIRMLVALGRKPVTDRDLATVALGVCFAGNACELINQLRRHVILSLLLH